MCRDNESCLFVTLFCAILNIRTGQVDYSNGGHNLPYRLHRDDVSSMLENVGGRALGLVETSTYSSGRVVIEPGESLVLYTDGVTEAMDPHETLYSRQRLERFLAGRSNATPRQIVSDLIDDVRHFAGATPQSDDITVLVLHYSGSDENAADRVEIKFTNKLSELERLNHVLTEFGRRRGLAAKVIHDLNLAMEEILINIISHGYVDEREHEILVRLGVQAGVVSIDVEDDGRPFNPLEAPQADRGKRLEERTIGGLGIHLVRNLMDGLEYTRKEGRNQLTMKKRTEET
jgi:sigma-B regulation protein RsbU (phosphoserine phosphatase)